jgi:ribose transport system ATP-binding protein/rhamnose transport system ATP-binding protein
MTSITKKFGPIEALREVDFEVMAGEVMALVGENGAGKSTLVKILAGIHHPDAGVIQIDGRPVELHSTAVSQREGIAVAQQELSLVPTMSAAENVFLGHRQRGAWMTDSKLVRMAAPYLELVGLGDLDPRTKAENLSVAERQLVELARLVARDARILILDEPTAALADNEIARVKRVVRSLPAGGRCVIYVTHRLGEVFELAHRVTVLRNGRSESAVPASELNVASLVERMLGRPLGEMFPPRGTGFGEAVLEVRGVLAEGLARPVTLSVRSGEIVGLAGQVGSGTGPLLQAMAGVRRIVTGDICSQGRSLRLSGPRDAIRAGIAYCSGDRKRDGLFGIRSVAENLTAPALDRVSPGGWVSSRRERTLSLRLAQLFKVDPRRIRHLTRNLSGGNQQKVALAKWLGIEPRALLVEEPTIGVDVGARAEIYTHLRDLAQKGLGIVFASSDIQEVLGLADTVASFYRGRLVNVAAVAETDAARVLREVTHPIDSEQGAVA